VGKKKAIELVLVTTVSHNRDLASERFPEMRSTQRKFCNRKRPVSWIFCRERPCDLYRPCYRLPILKQWVSFPLRWENWFGLCIRYFCRGSVPGKSGMNKGEIRPMKTVIPPSMMKIQRHPLLSWTPSILAIALLSVQLWKALLSQKTTECTTVRY
jgi:hypothetical protein